MQAFIGVLGVIGFVTGEPNISPICFTTHGSDVPVEVTIVSYGRLASRGNTRLSVSEPPIEVAVDYLTQTYGKRFVFTYVRTMAFPCLLPLDFDHPEFDLTRWYYQLNTPGRVLVFVTPGGVPAPLACEATEISLNVLAANWNILMFNTVGGIEIKGREVLSTSLGFGAVSIPPFVTLALSLINKYDWKSVFVLFDEAFDAPVPRSLAITLAARLAGSRVSTLVTIRSSANFTFKETLVGFRNISRVMVFYGHAANLRRLLVTAHALNMTGGQYVYIATEIMVVPSVYGNLTWCYNDENDEVAHTAFQSLLVLQPLYDETKREHSWKITRRLAKEFRRRSLLNYNTSYPPGDDILPILMGTYMAVILLGRVLNETWEQGLDMTDGKRLADNFLNRTFRTSNLEDIFIDSNGIRVENQAIAHFSFTSGLREPFLVQYASTPNTLVLLKDLSDDWPSGKWPPPSEPHCGYRGDSETCRVTDFAKTLSGTMTGICLSLLVCVVAMVSWLKNHRFHESWWTLDEARIDMGGLMSRSTRSFNSSTTL